MRTAWILWLATSPLLVLAFSLPGSNVTRGESGIKIGERIRTSEKGSVYTSSKSSNVGRGNSGVRLGGVGRFTNSTRQRSFPTTTTTTSVPPPHFTYAPQSSVGNNYNITDLKVSVAKFKFIYHAQYGKYVAY